MPTEAVPSTAGEQVENLSHAVARRRIGPYRTALAQVWTLLEAGPGIDPGKCGAAIREAARLAGLLGEPAASALRRRWEREHHRETGRCPRCGERGELHAEGDDSGHLIPAQSPGGRAA